MTRNTLNAVRAGRSSMAACVVNDWPHFMGRSADCQTDVCLTDNLQSYTGDRWTEDWRLMDECRVRIGDLWANADLLSKGDCGDHCRMVIGRRTGDFNSTSIR